MDGYPAHPFSHSPDSSPRLLYSSYQLHSAMSLQRLAFFAFAFCSSLKPSPMTNTQGPPKMTLSESLLSLIH